MVDCATIYLTAKTDMSSILSTGVYGMVERCFRVLEAGGSWPWFLTILLLDFWKITRLLPLSLIFMASKCTVGALIGGA